MSRFAAATQSTIPAGIVPLPKSLTSAGEQGAPLSETKELLHTLSGATPAVETGEACMHGLTPQGTLAWTPETTSAPAPTPPVPALPQECHLGYVSAHFSRALRVPPAARALERERTVGARGLG